MSIKIFPLLFQIYIIICDNCTCDEELRFTFEPPVDKDRLSETLKGWGWVVKGDRYYCEKHHPI